MSHRERLAWAQRHLQRLDREFRRFLSAERSPYVLHTHVDRESGDYITRIRVQTPLPRDFSLIVGDIVHNVRSALDGLVFQLAIKESGVERAAKTRNLGFPIADTFQGFHGTRKNPNAAQKRRIALLSDVAQRRIELLQPYQTRWYWGDPHPLAFIRELSNEDKHRRIVVTGAIIDDFELIIRRPNNTSFRYAAWFKGPFRDGTVLCRVPAPRGDIPEREVHVQPISTVDIAFAPEGPGEGRPVRSTLRSVIRMTASMLSFLEDAP